MYKVLREFIDKETMVKQNNGSDYTPSSDKRAKELVEKGFIKEVNSKKTKKSDKS